MSKSAPNSLRHTLATLADDLGISRATVSNAYNRPDQLSADLRERILSRARELRYPGPNAAARRLTDSSLTTVGVMFSEKMTYPFLDAAAREFMIALGAVAEEHQVSLLLIPAPVRGPTARDALETAVLDALVMYSLPDDDDALTAALNRLVPTIVVDQPRDHGDVAFVGIDDRGGARSAMEHVLGLGHTKVAVVTYRLGRDVRTGSADLARQTSALYSNARERLAGYAEAVEAAGLEWSDVLVFERPEHSHEDGFAAGRALLDAPDPPTAIVAFSDVLAGGVLDAAAELGIGVPDDLSVVGFDDSAGASERGLTTVHQPIAAKGTQVGQLLVEAWRTGRPPRDTELSVDLIVRSSTSPPPH